MNRITALLLMAAASVAPAQTAPTPATTITVTTTAPIDTTANVASDLPRRILEAQQIILYTPDLARADLAEAMRKAILSRGSEVVVVTNKASLLTRNSYLFRLALMRTKLYTAPLPSSATAILLLDGNAYTGPGVSGRGMVTRMPLQQNLSVTAWMQRSLDSLVAHRQQVDPVQLVRLWYKVNRNVSLW